MRLSRLLAAAALSAAAALPLAAEPYEIDKSHAHVMFSVDHLGFSAVHGQFREFDAEIDFDPENVEAAKVNFVIEAASVETFWDKRDAHIRGADFLDVENHPQITFVSKEVRLTSADTAEVVGDVTIRGVTNEETFQVRLNKIGPSPFNKSQTIAGFTIEGEIDRTKYGIGYGAPAIGTVLPVRLDLEASPKGESS